MNHSPGILYEFIEMGNRSLYVSKISFHLSQSLNSIVLFSSGILRGLVNYFKNMDVNFGGRHVEGS